MNRIARKENKLQNFPVVGYKNKPCFRPISAMSQESGCEATNNHGVVLRKMRLVSKNKADENLSSFEELLLASIDEGLSLFGESSKRSIYSYLEETFEMSRSDIPYSVEEFTDALERIFGIGAKMLEIQIMKYLFNKMGVAVENYPELKSLTFIEYVKTIKLEKKNRENLNYQQLKWKIV